MFEAISEKLTRYQRPLQRAQATVAHRVGNPLATALFGLPVGLLALLLAFIAGVGAPTSD
jgi:hypothetical protein